MLSSIIIRRAHHFILDLVRLISTSSYQKLLELSLCWQDGIGLLRYAMYYWFRFKDSHTHIICQSSSMIISLSPAATLTGERYLLRRMGARLIVHTQIFWP